MVEIITRIKESKFKNINLKKGITAVIICFLLFSIILPKWPLATGDHSGWLLPVKMPDEFRNEYNKTKEWDRAAWKINTEITNRVDGFYKNQLEKVVARAADTGADSLKEIKDVLEAVDPNVTAEKVASAEIKYDPEAYEKWKAKQADKEAEGFDTAIAEGGKRITGKSREEAMRQIRKEAPGF